jgi:hypothetical protein
VGNVENGDTRTTSGRKVALERGEEPDFDAHRLSGRWSSERRGDDRRGGSDPDSRGDSSA